MPGFMLGTQKGDIIENLVKRKAAASDKPLVILEAGSHEGDGTLRIHRGVDVAAGSKAGHFIVSIEEDEGSTSAQSEIVEHALGEARLQKLAHAAVVAPAESVVDVAKAALTAHGAEYFDIVLLDHGWENYLPHVKQMIAAGILRSGSVIHVDNTGRFKQQLKKYVEFVKQESFFKTDIKKVSQPYPDSVGVSEYLGGLQEQLKMEL
eukprot:TRINITY_DN7165_c0_g5_i4.p2 TRINITY_DN7165_c0_g5~~TRINITY_DN7165_c0_g5_i4.p2  ORF type:complete len:207 (+),score=53.33 TRINITY_DN7165_c0_g5_i4:1743-2363(+)